MANNVQNLINIVKERPLGICYPKLQIGGSKLRSSLNSLKTDFTLENYYFPVIIDMYHKKETCCWTNITNIMGSNFQCFEL